MPDEKIVRKIQMLFAKKESNFKAEAETALLKAQELMLKYGITMQDVTGQEVLELSVYHSQAPLWHGRIASILAKNFRCKYIWTTQWRGTRKVRVMTFIGYPEDAEIIKEAYMYAISLIRYNIRCLKKRYPRVKTPYINTYIQGFIAGLRVKFQEQVEREEWGLLLVTPVPVEDHYESYNPVPIKPRGRLAEQNNNQSAYKKGYFDGKSFQINMPKLNIHAQ